MPTSVLVGPVPFPAPTPLMQPFTPADFTDAYAVPLPAGCTAEAPALAYALLGQAPAWVHWLMRGRDALVRPLGLRTSPPRPAGALPALTPGLRFGPFRVFSAGADEVLLGQDDRHLDFRVWVLRQPGQAVVATAVRYHNAFGRVYFALVRPFHRLIVPAMLRAGGRRLGTSC